MLTMQDCNKLPNRENYTLNHKGKMTGMYSLSTERNEYCEGYNSIPGTVCSHCYSKKQSKMYPNLNSMLYRNGEILKEEIYPMEYWPLINAAFFRLESFGDVDCVTQEINYFNLCNVNPHVTFAQWTKNITFIDEAIEITGEKPSNLILVYSSLYLNKEETEMLELPYVDKVFTVYEKDFAKENEIEINCGKKKCLTCQLCYHKNNGVTFIRELLK